MKRSDLLAAQASAVAVVAAADRLLWEAMGRAPRTTGERLWIVGMDCAHGDDRPVDVLLSSEDGGQTWRPR